MHRFVVLSALVGLLVMVTAGPAVAGMVACPPQPPPGSTLECSVSNADPDETIPWRATFADGTEEEGEVTTDGDGAGGLAVDIPDDPELSGTEFTIDLEDGGSYTGAVGPAEEQQDAGDAEAATAGEEDADPGDDATGDEGDDTAAGAESADDADDDADAADDGEQVSERPDDDTEVALGAGGAAGSSAPALLLASLGLLLALTGGGYLVRAAVAR